MIVVYIAHTDSAGPPGDSCATPSQRVPDSRRPAISVASAVPSLSTWMGQRRLDRPTPRECCGHSMRKAVRGVCRSAQDGPGCRSRVRKIRRRRPHFATMVVNHNSCRVAVPLSPARTPPRTSTPSRPSPNSLARNDARNTRSTQRTQRTVRAQLGLDHISTLNAHYNDEAYRQRYVHEKFTPEQIARALRATKGGIAGRPACCAARARP